MTLCEQIERHKTRAPSKVGWYYGRKGDQHALPLRVVLVQTPAHESKQLRVLYGTDHLLLSNFDWYGPVPACALLD